MKNQNSLYNCGEFYGPTLIEVEKQLQKNDDNYRIFLQILQKHLLFRVYDISSYNLKVPMHLF